MDATVPSRCAYPPAAGFCPRPATREFVDGSGARIAVCEKHYEALTSPTPGSPTTARERPPRLARMRRDRSAPSEVATEEPAQAAEAGGGPVLPPPPEAP